MSDRSTLTAGDVVRVLVVGDSSRVEAVFAALEAALPGAAVLSARSDDDALEVLAEESVDCVLPDVGAGNRTLLLEAIRARADVPIVALAEERGASDALEAGATDVIYPGESPEAVTARVMNAVERGRPGEDRYRSILETQRVPVVVLDEEGDLEYATPAIETVTGYTPDEIDRRGFLRLLHPEDREDAREAIADVRARPLGSTRRERYRVRHADDTWRVLEMTMENRLADPAVEGVVLTLTERTAGGDERASQALEDLEGAVLALGDDWEVEYAGGRTGLLFDRPVGGLEGAVVWDLLPEAVRGRFYERVHEARARGSVVAFEIELDRWLEVHVHPGEAGVTLYAREIEPPGEERDRVDLFEAILDALEDAVIGLEGDRVTVANAAAFDLWEVETPVGYTLSALFPPDLAATVEERARSPVRRAEPIEATLEVDGESRSVAVSVTPLSGEDRAVCVITETTDEHARVAALSALYRTAERLGRAETPPEVRQAVADAVADALSVDVAALYVLEDGRTVQPAAVTADGTAPDLPAVEAEATPLGDALEADGASTHDPLAFEALLARAGIRADRVLTAPVGRETVLVTTRTDPAGFADHALEFVDAIVAMAGATLERLERESELRERESDLERRRARLEALAAIDERTRAVTRRLVRADSREEIEEVVCEQLAAIEWLAFAWIGEVDVATETVTPRTRVGDDGGYLEDLTVSLEPEIAEPAGRAAAIREVTTVENVVDEPGSAWRRAALERDIASVLAVPIAYDEYVYGVLAVYSDRPSAFREEEREAFAWLGETVAYAINAVETRRALLADGVTELEVAVDGDGPLLDLARRVGRRLEVATVVPRSAGESTVFLTVEDGSAETIREAASDLEAVESVRRTVDREDGSVVELLVSGPTVAATIADHGGVLGSLTGGGERPHLEIELPRDSDVRSFVAMLERKYPGVDLLARRERDRSLRTRGAFRADLTDRLTDRQRRTLETAYYSGFFEWPRESTGEEVADSLGVSQPTFNRHFRAAERTLFSLLFEEGGE
ncbi:bacterio-opsin activator domain-containing protein [Natrialbaceae archaeon A-gly3]